MVAEVELLGAEEVEEAEDGGGQEGLDCGGGDEERDAGMERVWSPVADSLEEAVVERDLLPVRGRLSGLLPIEEEEAGRLLVDLYRASVQLPDLVLHRKRSDFLDGLRLCEVNLREVCQSIDFYRSLDSLQRLEPRNLVLFAFALEDQEVNDGCFGELRRRSRLELEHSLRLRLISAFRLLIVDIKELKEFLHRGWPDTWRKVLMYRHSERRD